jgi:tetratricopeptide (TPR) repeat protein
MITGREKFKHANALGDAENYEEAIPMYLEILAKEEYDSFKVLLQLGGAYFFSGQYSNSYEAYKEALLSDPDNEIASLGFYLSCVKLDRLYEGLLEMIRFFKSNPPELYNDTIDELLSGLKNGFGADFEDIILEFEKLKTS